MLNIEIPISSFLRFYEASPAHKVRMVQDSRESQYNPQGYVFRDYYRVMRDTMRSTHWRTGDLGAFKNANESWPITSTETSKIEAYRQISSGYIRFIEKHADHTFDLSMATEKFANLILRLSLDVGVVTTGGERLALKLWYPSKGPTRLYRQGFEHLTTVVASDSWGEGVKPAILDTRRSRVLKAMKPPKDVELSLRGQAAAFEAIWNDLGP